MKDNESMLLNLEGLATTNISDALDALGLKGATCGILPVWESGKKIIGRAVTVKLIAAGETKATRHLGVNAIEIANPGDVIVIDNAGRIDTSCFGGVLATAAKLKGISGVVIDGACRDVDEYVEMGFPVSARSCVVETARNRIIEESTNKLIQFGGVQVRPGDMIVADRSGTVVVPSEHLAPVIEKASQLAQREDEMVSDLKKGMSLIDVDRKYGYEAMLESTDSHKTGR